jgi:D-xylose transport system permease protein
MSEMINEKATTASVVTTTPAVSVEVPAYMPRRTLGQLLRGDLGFLPVLLTLVVIAIYFEIASGGFFLLPRNLSNLVLQIATIAVDSLAVTLVLLLGEIDLSVASVGTLGAVVMGVVSARLGYPAWAAILIALAAGALVGFINGLFIALLRLPSFIVTLAAFIGYEGLLLYLLNGQATLIVNDPDINGIAGSPNSFLPWYLGIGLPTLALVLYLGGVLLDQVNRRRAGLRTKPLWQLIVQIVAVVVVVEGAVTLFENYQGVPYSTAILFFLILLFWLILTKTPFGRHIYAVGGNAEAARRAGINVVGIRITAFTLCSTLAVVGGVLAASRQTAVSSQVDPLLLLQAIGAAVIGGISLFGGRGSVWSIILGALIIGSLVNGLALLNGTQAAAEMIEGAVLLLAVTVDAVVRRAQARSGR